MTDLLQIALQQTGWIGYALQCALAFALCVAWRYLWAALALVRKILACLKRPFLPFSAGSVVLVFGLGGVLHFTGPWLSDGIQYAEQRFIHPVYVTSDTAAWVTEAYERELQKHCFPSEFEIVKSRTREIAAKVGSTPLALYQVYHSEAGMNPFVIRQDGIAAGPIQFTRAGLIGLPWTLEQIKDACVRRDADLIMNATEAYLVSRAKGRALPRPCDLYCCVFAPGLIGCADDRVLYSAADGDAYTLNSGLDGWYVEQLNGRQLIRNSRKMRNGAIELSDLILCLEYKKSVLCSGMQIL